MLKHAGVFSGTPEAVIYGTVSLYSPQEQDTTIYLGGDDGLKAYLNGNLVYERFSDLGNWRNYQHFFPVTLREGRNILLVGVPALGAVYVGFEPGTEYTVANPGVGYAFSKSPIHINDTFTLDISAENVFDLAGWQFDIIFDPAALEAINVSEGDFLKTDGGTTFFQGGSIDNAAGKITGLNAARLSTQGVGGTGTLLQVRFKAKATGQTELALHNFKFGSITGENIPAGPHEIRIAVEGQLEAGDVDRDGEVSILDLILVAQQLGKRVPAGSAVDVNGDGIVSILDLIRVSQGIGNTTGPAAPSIPLFADPPVSPRSALRESSTSRDKQGDISFAPRLRGVGGVNPALIESWIAQARLEDDGSHPFKQGIENLENLLASLVPKETALLANYPNPFNPETWIPYQLAESAEVTLTIYDMNGEMVRCLPVGYQAAGMYQSRSRAVHWDGRNQLGESVASGLYFYSLTVRSSLPRSIGETRTGDFTATRRMLILK